MNTKFQSIRKSTIFLILLSIVVIFIYVIYTENISSILLPTVPHSLDSEIIVCNDLVKTCTPDYLGEQYYDREIRRHPNLPDAILKSRFLNHLMPSVSSIRWSGQVYQESWNESPKFLLYSANFDSRLYSGLVVRILSVYDDYNANYDYFCQFWYNETENPVMSQVYESYFYGRIYKGKRNLRANFMSCKVPSNNNEKIPIMVSIVKEQYSAPSNILKIGGSPYQKKMKELKWKSKRNITIGLCGKSIHFYNKDFSVRLIEWIEILRNLGVSKFFLYKASCHKNVEKVLDYYESKRIVKLVSFYYPPPYVQDGTFLRLWTKINVDLFNQVQKLFYGDCIQRNKDDFDYLAVFDYDEIPILKKHQTLPEFLQYMQDTYPIVSHAAGLSLKWKIFYSNISPGPHAQNTSGELYILRHNQRAPLSETRKHERLSKSIYNTNRVLLAAIHGPLGSGIVKPLSTKLKRLSRSLAYTGHFGDKFCNDICMKQSFEEENALLQYEDKILTKMKSILEEIK